MVSVSGGNDPPVGGGTPPRRGMNERLFTFFRRTNTICVDVSSIYANSIKKEDAFHLVKDDLKLSGRDVLDIQVHPIRKYIFLKLANEDVVDKVQRQLDKWVYSERFKTHLTGWKCDRRTTEVKIFGVSPDKTDYNIVHVMSQFGEIKDGAKRGKMFGDGWGHVTDGTVKVRIEDYNNGEDVSRPKLPPFIVFEEEGEIWKLSSDQIEECCWKCLEPGHIGRYCRAFNPNLYSNRLKGGARRQEGGEGKQRDRKNRENEESKRKEDARRKEKQKQEMEQLEKEQKERRESEEKRRQGLAGDEQKEREAREEEDKKRKEKERQEKEQKSSRNGAKLVPAISYKTDCKTIVDAVVQSVVETPVKKKLQALEFNPETTSESENEVTGLEKSDDLPWTTVTGRKRQRENKDSQVDSCHKVVVRSSSLDSLAKRKSLQEKAKSFQTTVNKDLSC